ncbi:tetratricopeptide repeat protein [Paucibacter sp. APW11]|uniref:Tetratricopeptide repeat protein n=1 Tax=Roseateles aquae TaxID=3077235 RepID=A0ABU3PCE7_9BURK|nr:tetratricopeptide repeat protein [Paucibacter sp. APW11]MDT9000213.1 tetratricopeptide repeat protein [Paucibacter sp. APW11]
MPQNTPRPPSKKLWTALALASLTALSSGAALAASPAASEASTVNNSDMDAPMFYQLLVGEMELRAGQPGVAFQVLLDAARRSQDEALYRRVVSIALQARAGEQALQAARAWADSLPNSAEAHQAELQLLALLNRPADAGKALKALLANSPEAQRVTVIASLPQLFQRTPVPQQVLESLQPALKQAEQQEATRLVALNAHARLALNAGEQQQALALSREAAALAPEAEEPLAVALELMVQQPAAEELITAALNAKPDNASLRQAYGRALARAQRISDAAREFRRVTELLPEQPSPWFALGSLELELQHQDVAESALKTFLQKLEAATGKNDSELTDNGRDARQQALLLLAQAAEQRGMYKAAEGWLNQVDTPKRLTEVTYRRASLLLKQGQLDKARKLIQGLPGESKEEQRSRFMAESQLLREAQQWAAAYELLQRANEALSDDADMIYEQSMMAEKLGRNEEMEALLRRVMVLRPEHFHAYNALGYSLADRKQRLDEARELIIKALSFAPKEPFILDSMGWVEYRQGKLDDAITYLRQAFASRPDAEIAAHLGEVLWVSGQREEAQRIWTEGAKRDPKNEALRETQKRLKSAKPAAQ